MGGLSRADARRFYDRLGAGQDGQWWYEDPATAQLVAHAAFERAGRVFELGCGTGRLAAELLGQRLPPSAAYVGVDLSATMVALARERLSAHGDRARVEQVDGAPRTAHADAAFDRFVAAYVLDLLPDADIRAILAEAARVVAPGGYLCVVGLGPGRGPVSSAVAGLWWLVQRVRPRAVGGCRPLALAPRLAASTWRVEYRSGVVAGGVPSEVTIARRLGDAGSC